MQLKLSNTELNIIKSILSEHIKEGEVWAFGSRVGGKVHKSSDLDLIIKAEKKISLVQMGLLREAFSESNLTFMVDILDWQAISPEFRLNIVKKYLIILKF